MEATFRPLSAGAAVAREWGRLAAPSAPEATNAAGGRSTSPSPRRRTPRRPLLTRDPEDFASIADLGDARAPSG